MDGVFKSLIVKDVDRKKAVFYVVQFVGFYRRPGVTSGLVGHVRIS